MGTEMGNWVLILILVSRVSPSPTSMSGIEFYSKPTCELTAQKITEELDKDRWKVYTFCVQK